MARNLTVRGYVDPRQITALEAQVPMPGDEVVVDGIKAIPERLRAFGPRRLKVLNTFVSADLAVTHAFEGVEGEHPTKDFRVPGRTRNLLGVLMSRDGKAWFVPRSGGPVAVEHVVTGALARHVAETPADAADFFVDLSSNPLVGNFVLTKTSDDAYRVTGVSWDGDCGPQELANAEAAIDAMSDVVPSTSPWRR